MLRRTLFAFLGLAFLVLATTLIYVAVGLSGPESVLETASERYQQGRYEAAVRLLNTAERGLGPEADPGLRKRLLEIRSNSLIALQNLRPALSDIAELRKITPEDRELAVRQIRLTIESQNPDGALGYAEKFLETSPDNAEVLELAGAACQKSYQERLVVLQDKLETEFERRDADEAMHALRMWLYRPSTDRSSLLGFEDFERICKDARPEVYYRESFADRSTEIRGLIQRSQDFYRRSLEAGGEPVAAYLGLSFAMREAGRNDDLQWLAELYLQRFDHRYTMRPAIDLARLHVQQGRYLAAAEIVDRYLGREDWRVRVEEQRLDSEVAVLLSLAAEAYFHLEDVDGLTATLELAREMDAHDALNLDPELDWIQGLLAFRTASDREEWRAALQRLNSYRRALRASGVRRSNVDRLIQVEQLRVDIAFKLNYREAFFERAYRDLAMLDPNDAEPLLERTEYRLSKGDTEGALLDLRRASQIDRHNEAVLELRSKAMALQMEKNKRGVADALRRALAFDGQPPAGTPDLLLIPLAEMALDLDFPEVALIAAEKASRAFNWARKPRYQLVRAAMAAGKPHLAASSAQTLLSFHPGDREGLNLLREARQQIGDPTRALVRELLLAGEATGTLARDLLKLAVDRGDIATARHFARTIEERWSNDPRALMLVAEVHQASGDLRAARETLHKATGLALENDEEALVDAMTQYLLLTAAQSDDPAEVQVLVYSVLELIRDDTERLTSLAENLAEIGHPAQAFLTITPVLTEAGHEEKRSGRHFLLGALLALQIGDRATAEQYLLAAATFEDGDGATRTLALLQLRDQRAEQAAESLWNEDVTDLVSACLAYRFDRKDAARKWVNATLSQQPSDLGALLLRGLVGPVDSLPQEVIALTDAHGPLLLDALTWLDAPGFELDALQSARALCDAAPEDMFAKTVLARALANAGQPVKALELLQKIIQKAEVLIPAYDEVVRLLDATEQIPKALQPLVGTVTRQDFVQVGIASPAMIKMAQRQQAAQLLTEIGKNPKALQTLVDLWLSAPEGSGVGLDEVDFLASLGQLEFAILLCERIEGWIEAEQVERFYGTYFSLIATKLNDGGDPDLAAAANGRAETILKGNHSIGVATHFLYERDLIQHGALEEEDSARRARLQALLNRHIDHILEFGESNTAMIWKTVTRLSELRGPLYALDSIDQILTVDSSRLELWFLRAEWQATEARRDQALRSIRWIYDYAPTHPITLKCVALASRLGGTTAPERHLVETMFTDADRDNPEAKLALGILGLRDAQFEQAYQLLDAAPPVDDGAHLYFKGLSALSAGRREDARAAVEELLESYPDSPLTANVGHFSRQLSH